MNINEKLLEIVEQSEKLIIVVVLMEECSIRETSFEHVLHQKIKNLDENQFKLFRICFNEKQVGFPIPLTPSIYYFHPKNSNPIIVKHSQEALDNFLNDFNVVKEMLAGKSYDEAVFGEERIELINKTELMLETETNSNNLPSKTQMLRNFAKDVWQSAKYAGKGLPVLVNSEVASERYSICEQCPNLTEEARCTECGCFMKKKVNLAASSCPIGKWDSVQ